MHLSKESRIQMAISAYQKGQVKSIKRAVALFAVPESTIPTRISTWNGPGFLLRSGSQVSNVPVVYIELIYSSLSQLSVNYDFLITSFITILTAVCDIVWRITAQSAKQNHPKVIGRWFETVRATYSKNTGIT
ncbi:predicted protein [Aspergillus terreus NIH2624]|uniref:HTH psq-type domain-containing protein n=1 Tax=Aspergillus terreus (strain NIH 2624 / FGSC A1156) TaxID=341663 RepID=Q0CGN6_ASPTN|nr:uncharacterized protein ATEG_07156 [Aspergillus terreus NIH2624]EAU32540.1 predicted protein [Aspergillus terreus NIH2624]